MRIPKAVGGFFLLLFSLSSFAQIASTRLGDGTGEDWEPAVMAFTGSYVYALWPHFGPTTYKILRAQPVCPTPRKPRRGPPRLTCIFRCRTMARGALW